MSKSNKFKISISVCLCAIAAIVTAFLLCGGSNYTNAIPSNATALARLDLSKVGRIANTPRFLNVRKIIVARLFHVRAKALGRLRAEEILQFIHIRHFATQAEIAVNGLEEI